MTENKKILNDDGVTNFWKYKLNVLIIIIIIYYM